MLKLLFDGKDVSDIEVLLDVNIYIVCRLLR